LGLDVLYNTDDFLRSLVVVGQPFDTIKVKVQTSNEYSSGMDAFKKVLAKEGLRGLYRGMLTPLVFVTPLYAVCFWGFDMGQKLMRTVSGGDAGRKLSTFENSIAGGISAFPATMLMTPIERVKVILQTQKPDATTGKMPHSGPVGVVKHLLKSGGVASLYRGTVATLLRDVPGSVAYFGVYEYLKGRLNKPGELNKSAILFAGGMAGVANWAVAIPPDVLKSRLQSAPEGMYKGLGDVFVKMMRDEGPTALFKGFGPIMARAFPANAATFFGAELSYKALDSLF
jgi:solute carrier family 25 carnitine/acylcarnitine transporter 20/29